MTGFRPAEMWQWTRFIAAFSHRGARAPRSQRRVPPGISTRFPCSPPRTRADVPDAGESHGATKGKTTRTSAAFLGRYVEFSTRLYPSVLLEIVSIPKVSSSSYKSTKAGNTLRDRFQQADGPASLLHPARLLSTQGRFQHEEGPGRCRGPPRVRTYRALQALPYSFTLYLSTRSPMKSP